jgi:transcription elongation GreA/GreB family factor
MRVARDHPVAKCDTEATGAAAVTPAKAVLKRELLDQLEAQLVSARASHAAATEGAISDEARPENDKDTRGLEQSYLARGYAQRVAELEAALTAVATMAVAKSPRVAIGALVTIRENDVERVLYIAAYGGGLVLAGSVTVVTPNSPMGRALVGKSTDDDCELVAGGVTRPLEITAVA